MFKIKITKREMVAEETLALWAEKPEGFEFKAGQFVTLGFVKNPTLPEHFFTIASAPSETELMFVSRLTGSPYKKAMAEAKIGEELEIGTAMGVFGFKPSDKTSVFLIGGVGVAAARSIIMEELRNGLPSKMVVFYANRNLQGATFLSELEGLQCENLKIVPVMSRQEDWLGEKGYINEERLKKSLLIKEEDNLVEMNYYIIGPPKMVGAMRELLIKLEVPGEKIKLDVFTGY